MMGEKDELEDWAQETELKEESVSVDDADGQTTVYQTLANGVLSPRHRRLCQLAASGKSNADIAKELDYCGSRVSILLKNPTIADEVRRLQERIFEETIGARLKGFQETALAKIEECLKDKRNVYKKSEQLDVAKWLVEKLDGKAAQKHDIGENILGVLMDRLDAMKGSGQAIGRTIDVTPQERPVIAAKPKSEEDLLDDWVTDYAVR